MLTIRLFKKRFAPRSLARTLAGTLSLLVITACSGAPESYGPAAAGESAQTSGEIRHPGPCTVWCEDLAIQAYDDCVAAGESDRYCAEVFDAQQADCMTEWCSGDPHLKPQVESPEPTVIDWPPLAWPTVDPMALPQNATDYETAAPTNDAPGVDAMVDDTVPTDANDAPGTDLVCEYGCALKANELYEQCSSGVCIEDDCPEQLCTDVFEQTYTTCVT